MMDEAVSKSPRPLAIHPYPGTLGRTAIVSDRRRAIFSRSASKFAETCEARSLSWTVSVSGNIASKCRRCRWQATWSTSSQDADLPRIRCSASATASSKSIAGRNELLRTAAEEMGLQRSSANERARLRWADTPCAICGNMVSKMPATSRAMVRGSCCCGFCRATFAPLNVQLRKLCGGISFDSQSPKIA